MIQVLGKSKAKDRNPKESPDPKPARVYLKFPAGPGRIQVPISIFGFLSAFGLRVLDLVHNR
jgi:hypothetical protein